jgi:mono/diheme cytochrome c family protein
MTERLALGAALIAVLVLTLLPFEYAFDQRLVLTWFESEQRRELRLGQHIYETNCAACHGINLEGQPNWQSPGADGLMPAPPHDESGHTWHHPTDLLFAITKYGVAQASNLEDYESAMPAYEGVLTDTEILAVLAYIKSTWPRELRARHDELNARSVRP